MDNKMKKVGLFGGTFDPPHIGHLLIADEVKHTLNLDEVWFIPTFTAPHKRASLTNAKHLFEMLKMSIEDRADFHVQSIEMKRKGKSYTIDTMNELNAQYPNYKFFFIIGADMVMSLSTWKD